MGGWTAPTIVGLLIAGITALFASLQARAAVRALKTSAEANKAENLLMILQVEEAVAIARASYEDAVHHRLVDAEELIAELDALKSEGRDADAQRLAKQLQLKINRSKTYVDTKAEAYLGRMDRLCKCIRLGLIDETVYRHEYRDTLRQLVGAPEFKQFFEGVRPFRSIEWVNNCWAEDKTAVDLDKK